MKGNNSYQINNKGKLEFEKHNNRTTNLNYLNNKTQIFNNKNNHLELNEHSNPSSSLINEKKNKKFNISIFLKIMTLKIIENI